MTTALKDRESGPGQTNGASPSKEIAPIDRSLVAEASSAHSRINIPFNLENWKHLSADVVEELMWFHQWLLDNKLDWKEAEAAIGYDRSSIFKILKGFDRDNEAKNAKSQWKPNWSRIVTAIKKYRWQQKKSAAH